MLFYSYSMVVMVDDIRRSTGAARKKSEDAEKIDRNGMVRPCCCRYKASWHLSYYVGEIVSKV